MPPSLSHYVEPLCSTCSCQLLPTYPANRYSVICAMGLIVKLAIIYVILRAPKVKRVTNVFVLSLTIADGLFVLTFPTSITEYLLQHFLESHSANWC